MAVGAGRRTIGQEAGHTIHLEIEEVSGYKKKFEIENVEHFVENYELKILSQKFEVSLN